jgi:hypothetical protein
VLVVFEEIRQALVHPWIMILAQFAVPGVFGVMLPKEAPTLAARRRTVPLREGGQRGRQRERQDQGQY